jgi:hypothetical protein
LPEVVHDAGVDAGKGRVAEPGLVVVTPGAA